MVFALIFSFSACKDAYDITATENIPSLPGPENLKAVNEQEGVITLTWDPVYDAQEYEIWRKAGAEPIVKLNGSFKNKLFETRSIRYDDIISATNPLTPGVDYTYTVIAVSSASTSRAVGVVQNGISTTTIPAASVTKIPAVAGYTVPPVKDLAVAQITLSDGSKVVQVSWTKNPNPGVIYKGKFAGRDFYYNDIYLSPDGKAAYDSWENLDDGEQYKAEVTAYYSTSYYAGSAPAESAAYTHSDPENIIEQFYVSPITLYTDGVQNGHYNVSLYWEQNPKAPAGVTYEVYRHEGTSIPDYVEWEAVNVPTIPAPDGIGFIQVTLDGPAYRKSWTYKVVAKVNGEEVDSSRYSLNGSAWSVPTQINSDNYSSDPVTLIPESSRKIKVEVEQTSYYLNVAGDALEFYAVPNSLYDSSDQPTSVDQNLSQYTRLGGLTKDDLKDPDPAKRSFTSTSLPAGEYVIIAVLTNGNTKNKVKLGSTDYWTHQVYNN